MEGTPSGGNLAPGKKRPSRLHWLDDAGGGNVHPAGWGFYIRHGRGRRALRRWVGVWQVSVSILVALWTASVNPRGVPRVCLSLLGAARTPDGSGGARGGIPANANANRIRPHPQHTARKITRQGRPGPKILRHTWVPLSPLAVAGERPALPGARSNHPARGRPWRRVCVCARTRNAIHFGEGGGRNCVCARNATHFPCHLPDGFRRPVATIERHTPGRGSRAAAAAFRYNSVDGDPGGEATRWTRSSTSRT